MMFRGILLAVGALAVATLLAASGTAYGMPSTAREFDHEFTQGGLWFPNVQIGARTPRYEISVGGVKVARVTITLHLPWQLEILKPPASTHYQRVVRKHNFVWVVKSLNSTMSQKTIRFRMKVSPKARAGSKGFILVKLVAQTGGWQETRNIKYRVRFVDHPV